METKTFELVPVLDEKTGKYIVKDFVDNKKLVQDFIEREVNTIATIESDLACASARRLRTDIRKKNEAIKDARLNINALLLGDFNAQLKEIEGMLANADYELKNKITTYQVEEKGKLDNKPRLTTLVIKGYDGKAIDKIRVYAQKLGLQVEVK